MNKATQSRLLPSIKPRTKWVLLGLLVWIIIPWKGLEYGLFESTFSEILDAYAWKSINTSLISLSVFLLILLSPWRSHKKANLIEAALSISGAVSVLFIAAFLNESLGYSAAIHLTLLLLIFALALARMGFIQGDPFMTTAIVLIMASIAVFVLFPISTVFSKVLFLDDGTFTPLAFYNNITSFGVGRTLKNSLMLAVSVGMSSTFLALCFSLFSVRITKRFKGLTRIFSMLPIVTPPFVIGLSLILIFGRNGTINDGLLALFGNDGLFIGAGNDGWFSRSAYIYGFWGVFLAQTLSFTPICFMLLVGMVSTINPAVEEASVTMRASDAQTFYYVTLPLLRPGIANAFLLAVISSLADFGNPMVLGGDYDVLATEIYFSIVGAQLDYARAATLGILLLSFSLLAFLIQRKWIGKKSYVTVTGKGSGGYFQPLPAWIRRIATSVTLFWMLFTAILYGSILLGGFVVNWGADYTPTLAHYEELWARGMGYGAWPSYLTTLKFAAVGAPLTALMGLMIAYVTTRKRFIGRNIVDFSAMISFAIPGTVIGISYVLAFNTAPILINGTAIIIVISFIFKNMPVGIRSGISALSQIDKSLEEASLTQRASSIRTIFTIVLPLLRPAMISAIVFSFVKSMTTVSAIIFLVTADTQVATTYIMGRVEDGDYGQAVCYGSVLIVTMLIMILLVEKFIGRSRIERA
ncbi:MAG TPA: iron ABC transporter permease [Desulfobacterales bacterium]|nr:iron ABC transporter permease [Desulfobacterales bacterium]HIP39847.1 iron ABC transporter permease [Desulfocapsa sulfexigens]